MPQSRLIRWVAPVLLLAPAARCPAGDDVGPLVRSLWLVQRYGKADAVAPENDQKLKGTLSKALGKGAVLTAKGVQGLMEPSTFEKLAGADGNLDAAEVRAALDADVPESRRRLNPKVAAHADLLTTSFDMIDEPHRAAGETLVDWIVENYKPGQPLHVTVVCTGNSRRSILGATMGNVAAAYYGMPEVRFHSGGTAPTAFNPRTVACLKEIGVEVEPTGKEAPRGEPKTANPVYTVRWGGPGPGGDRVLEDVLRRQQPPGGLRRPDGLRRGRRRLPVRQGGGPAGLDAVPGPEDLRRQQVRGGQVRRAAGRHRSPDALAS